MASNPSKTDASVCRYNQSSTEYSSNSGRDNGFVFDDTIKDRV